MFFNNQDMFNQIYFLFISLRDTNEISYILVKSNCAEGCIFSSLGFLQNAGFSVLLYKQYFYIHVFFTPVYPCFSSIRKVPPSLTKQLLFQTL